MIRHAWLAEDAFITLRTVDNFVSGHGLRWNPAERVQAYTHPLWMLIVAGVYYFTQEVFITTIFLSIVISLATVLLFCLRIARSSLLALLGITILVFSKSFMDYSASGLENPLTHLILIIFFAWYLRTGQSSRSLTIGSLIAALGVFNRIDTALLFSPALATVFFKLPRPDRIKGAYHLALGSIPFLAWEIFSLVYYGFPFPNTAYAKLATGIERSELVSQGFNYLLNSLNLDPILLFVITYALTIPVLMRSWRLGAITLGVVFYITYVVVIGGDFMSGRFLTAPLLCSVVVLAQIPSPSPQVVLIMVAVAVGLGFSSPHPTLLCNRDYGKDYGKMIDNAGIADERAYYFQRWGLISANSIGKMPFRIRSEQVRDGREEMSPVAIRTTIGYWGYSHGPDLHTIDKYALADPLLARLPASRNLQWRIGHFSRTLPAGYLKTVTSGSNAIQDPNLATYYDKLALITRGPLFSHARWVAIWQMNLGRYDYLIDFEKYRDPHLISVNLIEVEKAKKKGIQWDTPGNFVLTHSGIRIDLGAIHNTKRLELSIDHNDHYRLIYLHGDEDIAEQTIYAKTNSSGGLAIREVQVPDQAVHRGYDRIIVRPLRRNDDKYSLGHLRLISMPEALPNEKP